MTAEATAIGGRVAGRLSRENYLAGPTRLILG